MRIAVLSTLIGSAVVSHSFDAAANGRFPQSNEFAFSPSDENLIVLRTTYGILPSHDNGNTWGFFCEDAVGYNSATSLVDPPIALTEDSSLVIGAPHGLDVSTDVGCNWSCIGGTLAGQTIVDSAVRLNSPKSAVVLTATPMDSDGGLPAFSNQAFETTDNGVTWNAIGVPIDPTVVVTTIDVADTDPNRLYVSGTRGYGASEIAVLFVSVDKGQHWITGALSSAEFDRTAEFSIFIGGVDPTNADRLYLRSQGQPTGGLSRLTTVTVGADGTPSFATTRTINLQTGMQGLVGDMLGFAIAPDGSKIYVGSQASGLWVAQTSDMVFSQTNTLSIQCLAARQTSHGPELWACSAAEDGFVAGVSTDDGKTFTPKLPLVGALTGPIACAPNPSGVACGQTANSSQCTAVYQTFCSNTQCGVPDASVSGNNAAAPSSSSSGCNLGALDGRRATLAAGLAIAAMALQRRRRRR